MAKRASAAKLPSNIDDRVPAFDRFASAVARRVSRAWFFMLCMLLVVIWMPTFLVMSFDAWQLVINTVTTIITFLLVALLQNTQTRADQSVQTKLNAIADALADMMRNDAEDDPRMARDRHELLSAVGLEDRVSST